MANPPGTPTRTPVPQQDVLPGDKLVNGVEWTQINGKWTQVTRDVNGVPQAFDDGDHRWVAHPNGTWSQMPEDDKGKAYTQVHGEWIGAGGKQTSGAQGQLNGSSSGQPTRTPTPAAGAPPPSVTSQPAASATPKPQATMPPGLTPEQQKQWQLLYGGSTSTTPTAQATPQATATPKPGTTITPPGGNTPPASGTPPATTSTTPTAPSGADLSTTDGLKQRAIDIAKSYNVPTQTFLNLIQHESGFNPRAGLDTPGHAAGLGQLMPSNFKAFGVESAEQLAQDPELALRIAARMLADGAQAYGGDFDKALANYFIGPNLLKQAIDQGGANWQEAANQILDAYLKSLGLPSQGKVSDYIAAVKGSDTSTTPTGIYSGGGGSDTTNKGATQQQPTPPVAPPNNITGYAPPQSMSPGFRQQFGATDKGVPVYQQPEANKLAQIPGTGPGQVGLRTSNLNETPNKGVPGTGTGTGVGFGYNPFALKAGAAGSAPDATNASALDSFGIPFTHEPSSGFSAGPSGLSQFLQNYQSNPYSADNPIEQARLAGTLVKEPTTISNGYDQQSMTVNQPFKRGGFIKTPPIEQADSMPPTDAMGQPRMYAHGGGLIISHPAHITDDATGQPIASLSEVRPEQLTPKPGGFSISNHVPGTQRYSQGGMAHFDDGGAVYGDIAGGNATPQQGSSAPNQQSTDTTNSVTNQQSSGVAPASQTQQTTPAVGAAPTTSPSTPNSVTNLLGLPATGGFGSMPQPPGSLNGGQTSGVDAVTGLPNSAALNDPGYKAQLDAYNRRLDQADADAMMAGTQAESNLFNKLGSPEARAEELANANMQAQRDATDYKYGLAGMNKPVEVQPPYAFPGTMPETGSPGVGQRWALVSPQQQYQTLLQFAQSYFSNARNQISAAKAAAGLNSPPAPSLATQLVNGLTKAGPAGSSGGGFGNSIHLGAGTGYSLKGLQ